MTQKTNFYNSNSEFHKNWLRVSLNGCERLFCCVRRQGGVHENMKESNINYSISFFLVLEMWKWANLWDWWRSFDIFEAVLQQFFRWIQTLELIFINGRVVFGIFRKVAFFFLGLPYRLIRFLLSGKRGSSFQGESRVSSEKRGDLCGIGAFLGTNQYKKKRGNAFVCFFFLFKRKHICERISPRKSKRSKILCVSTLGSKKPREMLRIAELSQSLYRKMNRKTHLQKGVSFVRPLPRFGLTVWFRNLLNFWKQRKLGWRCWFFLARKSLKMD